MTKVAVDTGGTFTDFVWEENGEVRTLKVPSTPEDPSKAIILGLKKIGFQPNTLIHGTTVATNAFLQRKGKDFLLLTTQGFEDVILIGRQTRPKIYDLMAAKPRPFVKEENIIGVKERLTAKGEVWQPLTEAEIKRILRLVEKRDLRSIAVSLLHSFRNPQHELLLEKALRQAGDYLLSVSHTILCEHREYERTSTTAINAYLSPILKRYLENLEAKLSSTLIFLQQSNGGYMPLSLAKERAVHTILSGPAGGAMAGLSLAKFFGLSGVITLDMGGTSTDVCLIRDYLPFTKEYNFDGFPVSLPVIDIHTVGAGGGSIAWVDAGGILKVGPESAGANPGPACYGKSLLPTVTDANLLLGRLIPEFFLGGEMRLYPERSFQAIEELGRKLGLSPLECALGILEIVNTNMARAVRRVSTERGLEPSGYWLIAFGGASGLQAGDLVKRLNLKGFIVPKLASSFSALGLFNSVPMFDFSKTVLLQAEDHQGLALELSKLRERARNFLQGLGWSMNDFYEVVFLDLRYRGQGYELCLPLMPDLPTAFAKAHRQEFGFVLPNLPIEITNIRLRLCGKKEPQNFPTSERTLSFSPFETRAYTKKGFQTFKVIAWDDLSLDEEILGPALIIDRYTTVFLDEDFKAKVLDGLTIFASSRGLS